MSKTITIGCLFILLFGYGSVNAQILAPPLPRSGFEAGYTYKWFHRDLEPNQPIEMDWEVAAFYARYGVTSRVTLSLEGGFWYVEHDDFPGMEFDRITVGGGITARLYEYRGYFFTGTFHYNEVLDVDRSPANFRKQTRGVVTGLHVERHFRMLEHEGCVWAGPMYVWDQGKNYVWGVKPPVEDDSSNNLGVALGASALIYDRVAPFFYLVYADYVQPRLGIALRL